MMQGNAALDFILPTALKEECRSSATHWRARLAPAAAQLRGIAWVLALVIMVVFLRG